MGININVVRVWRQHLGINLFKRPTNSVRWEDAADYSSGFIDVPEDLLKYEKNFLVGTLKNFLG